MDGCRRRSRLEGRLTLGATLAAVRSTAAWAATGLLAPRAFGGATFTVGLIAPCYVALTAGLVLAIGTRRSLRAAGYRRPAVGDLGAARLGWLTWTVMTAVCYPRRIADSAIQLSPLTWRDR